MFSAAFKAAHPVASAPVNYAPFRLLSWCFSNGGCSHDCCILRSCYVTAVPVAASVAATP